MHDPIRQHPRPSHAARAILLSMAVNTLLPVMAGLGLMPAQALAGEAGTPDRTQPAASSETVPYTLSAGENLTSVARKFHTTPDALKKMNFLRAFARGIEGIRAGDELDVPGTATAAPAADTPEDSDEANQQMADIVSQTGSFLSASPDAAAVSSLARDSAAGKAGAGLQSWLSQFGTARVHLDADKKLSLKNSQFDLLLPLWDSGHALVFTQGSLHRTDDRNQGNLGTGVRWYTDEWLAGLNAFFDDDMSLGHKRLGVGLEYWRDDLKLGANDYQRVSGWRDATDKQGYEARPASGWDLRAEGWLPSLPELGASLTWEQYYGDHVALFGKDTLQKNPWATTAGLSYTPIPLVSLYARERAGQSGRSDASLGVSLTYRPGIALATQLSADAVAASRKVAGSHDDLVSRNNNIVLDYREKQRLLLTAPPALQGVSSGIVQMSMSVTGNHAPVSVSLQAPELLSHGGSITRTGDLQYALRLPAWTPGPVQQNTYTLTSEAHDQDGNASGLAVTTLVVTPLAVMNLASSISPEKSTVSSDADALWGMNDSATLTFIASDAAGNPVAGLAVTSKMTGSGVSLFSAGGWTDHHDGSYTSTVSVKSASATEDTVDIMPQIDGIDAVSQPVRISESPEGQGSLTLTPTEITADGQSSATLVLSVPPFVTPNNVDVEGPVKNNVRVSAWKPLGSNNWGTTVTGTKAGTVTLMATDSGVPLARKPVTLTLTAMINAFKSTLVSSRKVLEEDGQDFATLTYKPLDMNNQPVIGIHADRFKLASENIAAVGMSSWKEVSPGEYQSQVTLLGASEAKLTLLVDGLEAASSAVTLKGIVAGAKITGFLPQGVWMAGKLSSDEAFAPDSGFPKTGMQNLGFQMQINQGGLNEQYDWSVNSEAKSWLSINQKGEVLFNKAPMHNTSTFTVTAVPKNHQSKTLTHVFTLNRWFTKAGEEASTWLEAKNKCEGLGLQQPSYTEMTTATELFAATEKSVGKLTGEWDLGRLLGTPMSHWATESYSLNDHYAVGPDGRLTERSSKNGFIMCKKDL